jgi:hypothetical protein
MSKYYAEVISGNFDLIKHFYELLTFQKCLIYKFSEEAAYMDGYFA